jgi:hypothetical protein
MFSIYLALPQYAEAAGLGRSSLLPWSVGRSVRWGAPVLFCYYKTNGGGKLRAARVIPSCRAYGSAAHYPLQSSNFWGFRV